jgi:isoamylase
MSAALAPGLPFPLGATERDGGVTFAVYSAHAQSIELCLFDASGETEIARHRLPGHTEGVWHGFLPGASDGLLYGLRAHGPYHPQAGIRFNPHKLLLDPYARAIVGRFAWHDEHYGFARGHPEGDLMMDTRDNGELALKACVLPKPERRHARPAPIPVADTVLYELHVRGFTRLHPLVPPAQRGTYAGLAHPAVIEQLRRLGVTTLSLQPVHYTVSEDRLNRLGLSNYWGYNTLGFFCADPRLSSTPDDCVAAQEEFRSMVENLHAAGFEVLIDAVYNHTPEGNEHGPTLSFRGLDNPVYYRLQHEDRARYNNITGCGNTVNVAHPRVTQLVLDSMRYWVEVMGVDGFRFDLATVLGRTHHGFDAQAPFFVALHQDPVLARAKLIAEPWDIGHGGYQLGRFPDRWLEWNDRYRDGMRQYWLTRSVDRAEFARRLLASSDRFHHGTRLPLSSVNFICAHDGFTLRDLVSYERKHNEANGEANSDGHSVNHSVNCGIEGDTDNRAILAQRGRLARALLATLMLSQGTPMLLAGDERGRSQRGNSNAYCQDNEISWLAWSEADDELADFTAALIALRRRFAAVRQPRWLGDGGRGDGRRDVVWLDPSGREMQLADWHATKHHAIGALLSPGHDVQVLLLFNPEDSAVDCQLPPGRWTQHLDSAAASTTARPIAAASIKLPSKSVLLLAAEHAAH